MINKKRSSQIYKLCTLEDVFIMMYFTKAIMILASSTCIIGTYLVAKVAHGLFLFEVTCHKEKIQILQQILYTLIGIGH